MPPLRKTLVVAIMLACAAGTAAAQTYPTKPVRIVVPFTPGGGVDATARVLAQRYTDLWGQNVVPDNRPGAGANLGTEIVARAAPDGYTLLVTNNAIAISAGLYEKLGYNALRDLRPVSEVLRTPFVLVVAASSPARSVADLVKMAKAKPGEMTVANTGIGSGPHLAAVLLGHMTQTTWNHIPYKGGGPAMQDLAAGRVQALLTTPLAAMPHVQAGRLRALAVSSGARWPSLAELPTIAESGVKGYAVTTWYMLLAPAKTPAAIVAKLEADTKKAIDHPLAQKVLGSEGGELVGGNSTAATDLLKRETALWTQVIKDAGIKPTD